MDAHFQKGDGSFEAGECILAINHSILVQKSPSFDMLAQIGSTLDISKGMFLKNKIEGKWRNIKYFYFYFATFFHS